VIVCASVRVWNLKRRFGVNRPDCQDRLVITEYHLQGINRFDVSLVPVSSQLQGKLCECSSLLVCHRPPLLLNKKGRNINAITFSADLRKEILSTKKLKQPDGDIGLASAKAIA